MTKKENVRLDSTEQVETISCNKDLNKIISGIVGKEFSEYREQYENATNFHLYKDFPIHLDIELNNSCNLRCVMCMFGLPEEERTEALKKDLPLEKAKELIKEGIPLGLKSICLSYYNEPLLKKGVIEFCSWARKMGIVDIIFCTNATLMTPEISKEILQSGITKMKFSIDAASKELYEKIRVGANYEVTLNNILSFLQLKKEMKVALPVTVVNFCLMGNNEHEVEDFKSFWKDKVDAIAIQHLVELNSKDTTRAKVHNVADNFRCPQPFQRVIVRSDGEVYPCCSPHGLEIPLGNVFDQSLHEIWNSPTINQLRELHKGGKYHQNPTCKKCAEASTGS